MRSVGQVQQLWHLFAVILVLWGYDVHGFSVSSRPKQHTLIPSLLPSQQPQQQRAQILSKQQYQKGDRFCHLMSNNNNNNNNECDNIHDEISISSVGTVDVGVVVWRPQLRRIVAGMASLGVVETAYLTYTKLFTESHLPAFCSSGISNNNAMNTIIGSSSALMSSACASVLTGPYSTIPFTDIPLTMLGLIAYGLVVYLALSPLIALQVTTTAAPSDGTLQLQTRKQQQQQKQQQFDFDDTQNRIILTSLTTIMSTFSVILMAILFGVLHQPCPYCIFSAACSIALAQMAWIGGCLPSPTSNTQSSLYSMTLPTSVLVGITAAVMLYFGTSPTVSNDNTFLASSASLGTTITTTATTTTTTTTLASAATTGQSKLYSPPEITKSSSQRALKLAQSLQSLDAKMYGAYWCSHCYDQKQVFGKPAFDMYVEYVECSKDGMNSQTKLCKAKDVPGYPTWEIGGNLYPGQQELEELEELVEGLLKSK
jgi:uncharacterized membrane protein